MTHVRFYLVLLLQGLSNCSWIVAPCFIEGVAQCCSRYRESYVQRPVHAGGNPQEPRPQDPPL